MLGLVHFDVATPGTVRSGRRGLMPRIGDVVSLPTAGRVEVIPEVILTDKNRTGHALELEQRDTTRGYDHEVDLLIFDVEIREDERVGHRNIRVKGAQKRRFISQKRRTDEDVGGGFHTVPRQRP